MNNTEKKLDTLNKRLELVSKKLEVQKNIERRLNMMTMRIDIISDTLDFHAKWLEWHHHLLFNNSERGMNKDEQRKNRATTDT